MCILLLTCMSILKSMHEIKQKFLKLLCIFGIGAYAWLIKTRLNFSLVLNQISAGISDFWILILTWVLPWQKKRWIDGRKGCWESGLDASTGFVILSCQTISFGKKLWRARLDQVVLICCPEWWERGLMCKEDWSCGRQCSLMLQPLIQSPIEGLHTQAPSRTEVLSHMYSCPSNDTGGLNWGTDGFTASTDGSLEESAKGECLALLMTVWQPEFRATSVQHAESLLATQLLPLKSWKSFSKYSTTPNKAASLPGVELYS